ncbi:hypothetical protein SAMN05192568_107012 [Methylobacterium pseudosasicola]|uniref:Uncharacterized protein n=1 Tax=Methylobacterium pseudosasicola TaxID=582667 RepID=A0A1I4UGP9_9HYPH|nr:hypothetical protein SAMN05192568_107012 [Methylobacterium pseudosasicola]
MATSAGVSTVLLGFFGPIEASVDIARLHHLATVLASKPYAAEGARLLSFDARSSARTRGVVPALL